ncbi:Hypothetical protein FKW44_023509 [Caligus rogercresseyi]|uniref:Uncharacterized protein n=1 Tax=Caligus rogercresseyi TaxID=217165 RepID=A0A7T8GPN3_CALRO|nr:Hypothetical protein FKW44_023509 [Caligus rogercresseyi]
MCSCLYEQWMADNGCGYQVDSSPLVMSLWDLRILEIRSILPAEQMALDFPVYPPLVVKICRIHSIRKIQIVGDFRYSSVSRSHFKILNQIFPFSSSGDKGHTNVDVASFVFHALRTAPSLVTKLNEVLSVSPIGRVNVWVTAAMIMHVGSDYGQHMLELTARDGACCLPLQKVAKYYKAISTAIRRTRLR